MLDNQSKVCGILSSAFWSIKRQGLMRFLRPLFDLGLQNVPNYNSASVLGLLLPTQKAKMTHLLSVPNAARSLLSVTTCKLVANLWSFHGSDTDLTELVALLVDRHHHLCR